MGPKERRPVWKMVREAAKGLAGKAAHVEIRDWVVRHYPGTNPRTVQCQIVSCTVNNPSRVNWPQNKKPRLANRQYDFLFRTDRGEVELYDPQKHGHWQILKREDGRLAVGPVGEKRGAEGAR